MADKQFDGFEGHFWLATDPDNKVPGTLKFDRHTGGQLSLIGAFSSRAPTEPATARDVSRILGADVQRGYTLDGCLMRRRRSPILGGGGRQEFSVAQVIQGVHYDADEPLMAERLFASFTGLLEWVRPNCFELNMSYSEQGGFRSANLTTTPVPDIVIPMTSGEVAIRHRVNQQEHRLEGYTFRQSVDAAIRPREACRVEEALDFASDLQDLLTLGTNRIVAFRDVSFTHPDFDIQVDTDRSFRETAVLHANWRVHADPDQKVLDADDMAFTFDDLGAAAGTSNWLVAAERFRSQIGRVTNSRYNKSMFLQDVLLARVAALESLDKQHSGGSLSLAQRLDRLTKLAGAPFRELFDGASDVDGAIQHWRNKARDERNDTAHHLGRALHSDIAELYFVAEGAYWLFVICMLQIATAPQAAFARLANNRQFRWTGEQLLSFL